MKSSQKWAGSPWFLVISLHSWFLKSSKLFNLKSCSLAGKKQHNIYLPLPNNEHLRTKLKYTKTLNIEILLTDYYTFSFLKLTARNEMMV